ITDPKARWDCTSRNSTTSPSSAPATPAYPAITKAFATAADNIAKGANVKAELDKAARAIDQDIKDNSGYPTK
ncbi:MAG: hypothetical protein HC933_22055, partial [Pleurocapsa sp. SU_196_0]|nr:hypothetical protein [Pleurocapsa sp. SU_196_0]